MILSKSQKYPNTLKVSHADSFGLKVLGKIKPREKKVFDFVVKIFEYKTLAYLGIFTPHFSSSADVEKIYNQVKYTYAKKLKPNEFFTVTRI